MKSGKYVASLGVLPLALGLSAEAQTPAGAVISHQSFADYYTPAEDRWYSVSSTISTIHVKPSAQFEILQTNNRYTSAGSIVQLPHLIANTGNQIDQHALTVVPSSPSTALQNLVIYDDVNSNGQVDFGEPAINMTRMLDAGEAQSIVIVGTVPSFAAIGTTYTLDVTAVSQFDTQRVKTIVDTVNIGEGGGFEITLGAMPICTAPVGPNALVEYDIVMRNIDDLATHAQDYLIDGSLQRGFLVYDDLPANTALEPGLTIDYSPMTGVPVFRDGGGNWMPYANFQSTDVASAFGLFLPESALQFTGQSGKLGYSVRLNPYVPSGTTIENTIEIDYDNDGQIDLSSGSVCTTVSYDDTEQTAAVDIRFLQASVDFRQELVSLGAGNLAPQHNRDDHFSDSSRYSLDSMPNYDPEVDGVYVEIFNPALNQNPAIADTIVNGTPIRVKLSSQNTQDSVYVELLETGLNTGVFRSELPIALSTTRAGLDLDCTAAQLLRCVLNSEVNDKLFAEYTGPNGNTVLVDVAIVDPKGVVFDSLSVDPVAGAVVDIRASDGSRAVNALTGEVVAPQTTDSTGYYEIPSLEDGQYYVDVTAPNTYTFKSQVAAQRFGSQRSITDASYGKDGYGGVTNSGLFDAGLNQVVEVFDVPLDINLETGALSVEKTSNVSFAEFGDTVIYTVKIKNASGAPFFDAQIIDTPAAGFMPMDGGFLLDGEAVDITRDGRNMIVDIDKIEDGETRELVYRMVVGPESRKGEAVNLVYATAQLGNGLSAKSPMAKSIVTISDDGLMSDRGYIVGSVWVDSDGDGRRDEGEAQMPGARVWRDDGSWVITDEEGRFTFYGQKEGRHMLRVDPESIPDMFGTKHNHARNFNKGRSVMVDIKAGDIVRADFGLTCVSGYEENCKADEVNDLIEARKAVLTNQSELDQAMQYEGQIGQDARRQQRLRSAYATADGDISSGLVGGRRIPNPTDIVSNNSARETNSAGLPDKEVAPDPELIARTIGKVDVKKGTWLWPKLNDEDKRYSRGGPIIVAIRPGIRPTLYINDKEISDKRLGARIETADRKTQIVAWYGVELPSGTNDIAIKGTDSFGNLRLLAETEMYSPSEGVELSIRPQMSSALADGQSPIGLRILSLDKDGLLARGVQFISLRAEHESNGERVRFMSEDLQPDNPGHQIRISEGEGYVQLSPLELPGRVRISATDDGGMNTFHSLEVKAPMRDLFAVGLIDVTAMANKLSGALEPVDKDEFPETLTTDSEASLFIKGRIKGNVLLTVAYDSQKTDADGLFRDIDPEKYYPIYGEASVKGFEAQSRSNLYVRVENKSMSAMWGDFRTDVRQGESLVSQRQSLTGANLMGKNGAFGLRAYSARGQQTRRTVRFAGQGVALFYTLPNAPLTPGSETLTVEVRAKDNPGLILEERSLQRFVDYLLDVETGQIILQEPIPSLDEDGNLLFLRARYETLEYGEEGMIAGAELSYTKGNTDIRVGGYYDDSLTDVKSAGALSIGVEQKLQNGKVFAEVGTMLTTAEDDTEATGTAFRIGGNTRVKGVEIDARLARADAEFINPDSPIIAGRTEARASARGSFFGSNTAGLSATYSENNETGDSRTVVDARYEKRLGQWVLQLGPRHQSIKSASGTNDESFTAANWRIGRNLNLKGQTATAYIEGEQSLSDDRQRLVIGGETSLGSKTRAYAVHRLIDQLPDQTAASGLSTSQANRHQGQTVFGVESTILPNTRTFGEYRKADIIDGRSGQASFGVRSDWPVSDGVTISPSFEHIRSLGTNNFGTGEEGENVGGATNIGTIAGTENSTSISVGLTDASQEQRRKTVRVETRVNSNSHFWGARVGWAEKIGDDFTGSMKLQLVNDQVKGGANSKRLKITSGLAWRPDVAGKPDVFAVYQFLDEQNTARDRQIHILSSHANLQVADKWSLSGRLAGKIENAQGFSNSAQLYSGTIRYDVSPYLDTEVRLSGRSIDWGEAGEWNFGLGVGLKASESFRVHGGYNFGGFDDANLDPSGYHRRGIYGGVTVAITEDWFGFLRPSD